jgi:hypothetical protein
MSYLSSPRNGTSRRTNRILDALNREYVLIGKRRVRSAHAWVILGFIVGIASGVIAVSQRGDFSLLSAQTATTVTVTLLDSSASEPGTNTGTFRISRTGSTSVPFTVTFSLSGTAQSGVDYRALPMSVIIPAGALFANVIVTPIDDTILEPKETIILTLAAGTDYVLGTAKAATLSLLDDESITITAPDASAAEKGLDPGTVTIARTGDVSSALTVTLSVTGTATKAADYQALPASVTFAQGAGSTSLTVTPIDDTITEKDETVIVKPIATAGSLYTIGTPASATVTIRDDELPNVSIAVSDTSFAEAALNTGKFTFTRFGSATQALNVNLAVSGTASSGSDYKALPVSILIPAGALTASLVITPLDDTTPEPKETVVVTLATTGTGYLVNATKPSATLTLLDNDDKTPPTVSLTSPANGASVSGTVTVTASAQDNIKVLKTSFLVDGAIKATDTSEPFSYAWNTTALTAGSSHTLQAKAYDEQNNSALSSIVTVTKSGTTPPPPNLGTSLPARMPESSGSAVYVSLSGSDTGAGSVASPFRTVGRAFQAASSGTTIYIRGGTYPERWDLRSRSFSTSNPVTIQNYPGESVVVAGDSTLFENGFLLEDDQGIRVRGGVGGGSFTVSYPGGNGMKVDNSANIEVNHMVLKDNGGQGLLVSGDCCYASRTFSSNVQVWDSTFTNNGIVYPPCPYPSGDIRCNNYIPERHNHSIYYGAAGSYGGGVRNGTEGGVIANNVIYDQDSGFGMRIGDGARGLIVTNNTVVHSYVTNPTRDPYWGQGISMATDGSTDGYQSQNIKVYNNLVAYSVAGVYGGGATDMSSNMVDNNMTFGITSTDPDCSPDCNFNNHYGTTVIYTRGTHNLASVDPLFVDYGGPSAPRTRNFHLQAGSPALGKANPAYAPALDADGKPRPASPAIGAFG